MTTTRPSTPTDTTPDIPGADTPVLRSLVSFPTGPAPKSMAIAVGVATGIPIIVFALLGQTIWGLTASLGAFAVLYCADRRPATQLRAVLFMALGLIASAAIGASTSSSEPLSILGVIIVGLASILLCTGFRIGPPGPLFFVLVYGAAGIATAPLSTGGGASNGGIFVALVAAGSIFAVALLALQNALRRLTRRDHSELPDGDALRFEIAPVDRVFIGRMIVALALSILVSIPLGQHDTYLVLMTALAIPIPGTHYRVCLSRSLGRIVGALIGSGIFLAIAEISMNGITLGIVLGILQAVGAYLVVRNYAIALVVIAPLALLITVASPGVPVLGSTIAFLIDTLLGSIIAAVVLLAPERWFRRRANPQPTL